MILTLHIEGRWQNIRRYVESLLDDGWTEMIRTGCPDFKFTRVELMREI